MLRRAHFFGLAVGTMAIGLAVHFHGDVLGSVTRDVFGDSLWAMMIAWWIGALVPHGRLQGRSVAALAICSLVEVSQLWHTPSLDAIRLTTIGHLVLGSGFDPRDFVAYAGGVLVAGALERGVIAAMASRRRRP